MENTRLKSIRNALNINQKEFASRLGIQQSYYSALELGKKEVTSKLLETLILKIGVNPEWYFSSKGAIFNSSNADTKWGTDGVNIPKRQINDALPSDQKKSPQQLENGERAKSFDKQKLIAEKAIQELILDNAKYALFRAWIFEFADFIRIIDDITYTDDFKKLIDSETAVHYYSSRSSAEVKSLIEADFVKLTPYLSIFKELIDAMRAFREKAKNIPFDLTGIYREEFAYGL